VARKPTPRAALLSLVSDFAKRVAPVYQTLGWGWSSAQGVPSVSDIEKTLRQLINLCAPEADRWAATGGLCVGFDEDGYPYLSMEITTDYEGCAVVAPAPEAP
jgi:hypothetical protein